MNSHPSDRKRSFKQKDPLEVKMSIDRWIAIMLMYQHRGGFFYGAENTKAFMDFYRLHHRGRYTV